LAKQAGQGHHTAGACNIMGSNSIKHGSATFFFMAKGHTGYCGLVRRLHVEKKTSGMHNCLNYCEIFIVYTQFTNMTAGCIIQLGGQRAARGLEIHGINANA
jgi:hypothetical protein